MLDLSPLEPDDNAHLIAAGKKLVGVIQLRIEVIVSDNYGQLDLLGLHRLLFFAGFLFLLYLVEAEFSVVHDTAYGRLRLRSDKNEIQIFVVCKLLGLIRRDDTERLSVLVYKSDARQIDIVVY